LENCVDINIRLKPTDFCMLQLTLDGGSTWTDVADLSDCAHAAAVDEIEQAIDRGDISGGGQQPGQGGGAAGVCYDYFLTLRGNDRWNSPVAIEENDTITVSNVDGAWWDGDITHNWQCADGSEYFLGECSGTGGYTQGTDPAPSVNHMRLVGNLPADATTPYFDMYNTAYTVPGGVALGEFFLQANDDQLPDNQGAINLHVEICKGGWRHEFDFKTGTHGWTLIDLDSPNNIFCGNQVAGVGFQNTNVNDGGTNQNAVGMHITFASSHLTRVEIDFDYVAGDAGGHAACGQFIYTQAGTVVYVNKPAGSTQGGTNQVIAVNADAPSSTELFCLWRCDESSNPPSGSTTIRKIVVHGKGADPF